MGFVSSLLGAVSEANDEVHGQRLLSQVQSTFECFKSLDHRVLGTVGVGYLQIRARLNLEITNWTREGRIRIARQMQDQARQALDTDVAGSYAKWLAGAWLESGERYSQKAKAAQHALDLYEVELKRTMADLEFDKSKEVSFLEKPPSVALQESNYKPAERVSCPPLKGRDFGPRVVSNIDVRCPNCNVVITNSISSEITVMDIRCKRCTTTFVWRRFPN